MDEEEVELQEFSLTVNEEPSLTAFVYHRDHYRRNIGEMDNQVKNVGKKEDLSNEENPLFSDLEVSYSRHTSKKEFPNENSRHVSFFKKNTDNNLVCRILSIEASTRFEISYSVVFLIPFLIVIVATGLILTLSGLSFISSLMELSNGQSIGGFHALNLFLFPNIVICVLFWIGFVYFAIRYSRISERYYSWADSFKTKFIQFSDDLKELQIYSENGEIDKVIKYNDVKNFKIMDGELFCEKKNGKDIWLRIGDEFIPQTKFNIEDLALELKWIMIKKLELLKD